MFLFALGKVEIVFVLRGFADGFVVRPRRSEFHPFRQVGDGRVRQLGIGGHHQIHVGVADGLNQPAFFRLAGHDDRPALASLQ